MSEFAQVWNGLDWSVLIGLLLSIIPALICITIHETAHGLVAYGLGDNTAKNQGRLTLNPIKHIDIMGLLAMVVLRFGWAKPVPVDMRNFKHPKTGMAITALAGPMSNFLLAGLILIFIVPITQLYYSGDAGYYIGETLITTAYLSVALGVFNLLPISPLDGSKIVFSFLRDDHYYTLMRYERYGMIIMIVLVWTGILGGPLTTATNAVFNFIYDGALSLSVFIFA